MGTAQLFRGRSHVTDGASMRVVRMSQGVVKVTFCSSASSNGYRSWVMYILNSCTWEVPVPPCRDGGRRKRNARGTPAFFCDRSCWGLGVMRVAYRASTHSSSLAPFPELVRWACYYRLTGPLVPVPACRFRIPAYARCEGLAQMCVPYGVVDVPTL